MIVTICIYMKLVSYLMVYKSVGIYIIIIKKICSKILGFIALFISFYIIIGISFYLLFIGFDNLFDN